MSVHSSTYTPSNCLNHSKVLEAPRNSCRKRTPKIVKKIPLNRLVDLKAYDIFKRLFDKAENKETVLVLIDSFLQQLNHHSTAVTSLEEIEIDGEFLDNGKLLLEITVTTDKKIRINILNFILFDAVGQFHTKYQLDADEDHAALIDGMEVHFIEMPKILEAWKRKKLNPCTNDLIRWLLLLGMVDSRKGTVEENLYFELEAIALEDNNLRKTLETWEEMSISVWK